MTVARVELFSRPGCHLCEEAARVLRAARRRFDFQLIERNVDTDASWSAAYGMDVPVVVIDGRKAFKHRIPARDLERYFERGRAKGSRSRP